MGNRKTPNISGGTAWCLGLLVLVFGVGWSVATAEELSMRPTPMPTNAARTIQQVFRVEGRADLDQGADEARLAALLTAQRGLILEAARTGELTSLLADETESSELLRLLRVDRSQPEPALLAWLGRAKVIEDRARGSHWHLELESPSASELNTQDPPARAFLTADVDGDGVGDMVAVGYDGALSVYRKSPDEALDLLARTPSYATLELVEGPGLSAFRTHLPVRVRQAESAGEGYFRAAVDFETAEVVNGRLLGVHRQTKELLLALGQDGEAVRIQVDQPGGFDRCTGSEVELKGKTLASETAGEVVELQVTHNGRLAWQSPEGLKTQALAFDLTRSLSPGWNLLALHAHTTSGQRASRKVWVKNSRLPGGRQTWPDRSEVRTVLMPMDRAWSEASLRSRLGTAGFPLDKATLLSDSHYDSERLLTEIRNGKGARELVLYIEAKSRPSAVEGRNLLIRGRVVTPSELLSAIEAGGYQTSVILLTTEPESLTSENDPQQRWHDSELLLQALAEPGRLALANREDRERSFTAQRRAARARLESLLESRTGPPLLRAVDLEYPEETMFRGWLYGR